MQRVKVVEAPVTLYPGSIVALTAEQAKRRQHFIRPRPDLGEDVFEATGQFDFKVGEEFGLEGPISKNMMLLVAVDGKPGAEILAEQREEKRAAQSQAQSERQKAATSKPKGGRK